MSSPLCRAAYFMTHARCARASGHSGLSKRTKRRKQNMTYYNTHTAIPHPLVVRHLIQFTVTRCCYFLLLLLFSPLFPQRLASPERRHLRWFTIKACRLFIPRVVLNLKKISLQEIQWKSVHQALRGFSFKHYAFRRNFGAVGNVIVSGGAGFFFEANFARAECKYTPQVHNTHPTKRNTYIETLP